LVGLALLGVWAAGIEPYWIEVTRQNVVAPLPLPLKVAHLSDLHTHGLGRRERAFLALLEREQPDLIVITGDTVVGGEVGTAALGLTNDPSYERAAELFRRFNAPLGVWAVRGNWENVRRVADERAFYERSGVQLLVNEAHEVRPRVWLVGLDDAATGGPDPETALRRVPQGAYAIGLFHSPASFDGVAGRVPLSLAGHTHGSNQHRSGHTRVPPTEYRDGPVAAESTGGSRRIQSHKREKPQRQGGRDQNICQGTGASAISRSGTTRNAGPRGNRTRARRPRPA